METEHLDSKDDGPSIAYRPKRRTGPKTQGTNRTSKATPKKRPVKLMMEPQVYEILVVHSLRQGMNLSEMVSDLVVKHLTQWTVHAKPGPRGTAEAG